MKLYDGRGKRFKELIDPTVIMKENRLKVFEVLPKHARSKWYSIWFKWGVGIAFGLFLLRISVEILWFLFFDERVSEDFFEFSIVVVFFSIFLGGILMLLGRRWTWKSKAVAIRTLAQQGFCPNCGYIIRDTPAESDGCTPCSECGHAWRVEPVDS